jgi:Na+-driven multidrug efflux pump
MSPHRTAWLLGIGALTLLLGGVTLSVAGFRWGVPAAVALTCVSLFAAFRRQRPRSTTDTAAAAERQRALSGRDRWSERAWTQALVALLLAGIPLWFILWWYFGGGCYRSPTC